ncbi:Pimeloyl-ACP methyl ester carboxylesterase [Paraburkholderia fungorum]|uniref:Pimeloyl-ACP methyl ester carboxylesterase n=1 Tax=Paraburkholderia fungorum TaxID=134537 RepID=A0A1H1HWX9_9BURK|nr:alpha/beta fold hydrolase [Paraburkholderia fungorum]SDR29596.1 Pimeloyl-ACP methyl ester carboxylesterase [Paraburkholderia fungorum]
MNGKPPVIFIHGFIGTFDVAGFDAEYAAPHLLGYGEYRGTLFDRISLPAQVEHIRAFVDAKFGTTSVDLVGHSVGGAIAMLFAHAYPDRVRRIVNVEGNFTLDDAFWSASVGRMTPAEAGKMLESFRADPLEWLRGAIPDATPTMADSAARWLDYQPASTLRAMGQSVVAVTGSVDYLSTLKQVFARHSVYLLSGERSHSSWNVPHWALEKSAGRETLDHCGHLLMIENPAAFSAAIRRFLN